MARLADGRLHPRDAKARLASEIVKAYHSEQAAAEAAREFDHIFKDKGLPENIETVRVKERQMDIVSLLKEVGLVPSKMEGRRLISQGGVKIDSEKVDDEHLMVHLEKPVLLKCGKRKFVLVHCTS